MFNNLNSTLKKVVVIFLIITLTYANLFLIGSHLVKGLFSYALEETEEANLVVANQELVMNKVYGDGEEQERIVQVSVETGIDSEEYPIKASTITLGTDLIEGALVDVKVTGLNKNSYTTGTWNLSEEGKVIISLVNENETLEAKEKGLDKFLVTYVFENSEVETIKQPLEKVEVTPYEGETLTNEGTDEGVVVNFEDINVEKELSLLNIENKDIHKTTIESGKVDYTESLNLDLSYRNEATSITIEDISNDFYNVDGQENEEIVLQYKTTTINKEDLINLLGEEGKLVITDIITNNVVAEITKEVLTTENTDEETTEDITKSNVIVENETVKIEYLEEVTDIRFELLNINIQSESKIDISDFVIENTKSILNVSDIENLSYLKENVRYVMDDEKTTQSNINFKDTVTRANLAVDNNEWIVGEANVVNYTITLDTTTEKSELFVNPMFLIELPSSVETIDTSKSEFTVHNDGGVFTDKKVFTTTVLGKKYVVITLTGEQTSSSIQNGNTTIDLLLELYVKADEEEGNKTTKIYYQNDTVTTYENGASFDTDEVEISLILGSEDKEEIPEENPEEDEEIDFGINMDLQMKSSTKQILQAGETIEYTISLYNYGLEEVRDLILTDILPESTTLISVVNENDEEVAYEYNEEARTVSINIETIEGATEKTENTIQSGSKIFKITVTTNELENDIYNKELINIAKVEKDAIIDEEYYVVKIDEEQVVNKLSKGILSVQIDQLPEQINEKEEITLVLKVENKGLIPVTDININVDIPQEILPRIYEQYLVYEDGEQTDKTDSTLGSDFVLSIQEIPSGTIHYLKLIGTVNEVEENKQISIVGTVNEQEVTWTTELVDLNGEDEPDKPITPDNPDKPVEPENPENPEEPTEPENPSNPDNPNEPTNPDNPESITDGFDLSLKQYLNKVTVENSEGTTTYEYTDTNFAKVEIHSKYMNGSKVTLEYKMIVKNEGTIPGYARKIVNYKPEGLEFNQDLNKDWYIGDDGNIYSVTLLNKLLNPGETAELIIILTKQMTNEDGGTIKNTVEIYEATNDENVEDLNSIPGDKLEGQNDMSTAQVIVAVKTGTMILYITLAAAVIAIIGLGFYKIKKITLNKKGGC